MEFFLLVLCYFLSVTKGHSWLACADYRAVLDPDNQDFSLSNCEGYGRGYYSRGNAATFSAGFGKFTHSDTTCQMDVADPIDSAYDDTYPYATWVPGSTVRIVWPAKNHAIGAECGETSSTDKEMKILYNPNVNQTSDLASIDDYLTAWDWHEESDVDWNGGNNGVEGIPFANCMDYCSDTDASPCFGDMIVPDFSESGFYAFMWYWYFTAPYVTCFDVYIDVDGEVTHVVGSDLGGTTTGGSGDDDDDDEPAPQPTPQPVSNNNPAPTPSPDPTESSNNSPTENSNNGDDDDDDDDDGDDDGDTDEPVVTELVTTWRVQAPMCFIDADYDKDIIEDTLNTLFEPYDSTFEVISYSRDIYNNKFNFTVETYTAEILTVAPTINNGTVCDRLEDGYGYGSCSVCNGGTIISRWDEEIVVVDDSSDEPAENDEANKRYFGAVYILAALTMLFVV